MKKNTKNLLLVGLCALVLFGFPLLGMLTGEKTYSMSERRVLAQKPAITLEALDSGSFMTDYESYTLDQFPGRDGFRRMKAVASRYLFRQKDNNGLYLVDGYLSRLEYPLNQAKLELGIKKLQQIREQYLDGTQCRLYLSIIPDKNYFQAPLGGYPTMDYDTLVESVRRGMEDAAYIDIFDLLTLEDFYKTDQHWRQERVLPVARRLAEAMGAELSGDFREKQVDAPFYGAYYGQAALNLPAETMVYLDCELFADCTVTSYGTGMPAPGFVYDMEKARGKDPYEMFLGGSDPLVIIENPNAASNRELVIFRDSFGSSLTPLMLSGYSKITLVDLRYLRSDLLGNFVEFSNQDVLFLYSTLVLNNTITM